MTDGLSTPCHSVRLLACFQSCTFHGSFMRIFPSYFWLSYLPFPWYICPQHIPQYVFTISPHHMPVPVQSSLGDLFGSLCHYRCFLDVFVSDLVFACHSDIHRSILISVTSIRFSCLFIVAHVTAPYNIAGLITAQLSLSFLTICW